MGTLVQVRDVPDDVHRRLKARAAAAGTSLSAYLREVLQREVARPTPEEFAVRVAARGDVELPESSDQLVRHLRDEGE